MYKFNLFKSLKKILLTDTQLNVYKYKMSKHTIYFVKCNVIYVIIIVCSNCKLLKIDPVIITHELQKIQ